MEDKRITAEDLEAVLQADIKALAEKMATAINKAKAGRIIADSEELVRDAHAEFRQQAYQRALDLLQNKAMQEDFSPSKDPAADPMEEQGSSENHPHDGKRASGV
jgi:hypothetical protein